MQIQFSINGGSVKTQEKTSLWEDSFMWPVQVCDISNQFLESTHEIETPGYFISLSQMQSDSHICQRSEETRAEDTSWFGFHMSRVWPEVFNQRKVEGTRWSSARRSDFCLWGSWLWVYHIQKVQHAESHEEDTCFIKHSWWHNEQHKHINDNYSPTITCLIWKLISSSPWLSDN